MKPVPRSFFAQDTAAVAQELLGKIITVDRMAARIVETEAYGSDPASHAYTRTERSSLMYDTYGFVYAYLIYGMYWCVNITTEKNKPGAVLIRAVEPIKGIEVMKQRRKTDDAHNLCSGPGKLCLALGIDGSYNGLMLGKKVGIYDDGFKVKNIAASSRIGIKDALDLQWRFYIPDNPFVSRAKPPADKMYTGTY